MTTPQQPGWYDDPEDPNAQRYWDGGDWTPHRQRKSISPPTQLPPPGLPPPPLDADYLPPPPLDADYLPPPPLSAEYPPPPPPGGPPRRSRFPTAVVGVFAVLVVAGFLLYKFVYLPHHPSSASTDSAPGASTGGGEAKFLSDLAAVGIDSSTAKPEALVAKGRKACSGLAAGESQDAAAADLVSASNHFFDQSSASKIVQMAVEDLCPQ